MRGKAKFCGGTGQIFVSGNESGLIDLQSGETVYRVTCQKEVTSFSFHPSLNLVVTGSEDGSWALHDLSSGKVLVKI